MCSCLLHASYWGPGPQIKPVPQLGIEPAIFASQACAQSTELYGPGLNFYFIGVLLLLYLKTPCLTSLNTGDGGTTCT